MVELKDKVCLITGGGTGLGKEVARQLAREGMHIGVNYSRSAQEAQETVQELETEFHVKALAIQADVSVVEEIERMVDETVKHFGRIDLLINNAGVTTFCEWSNLEGLNEEDWDKMLKVNTKAPFFAARAAARYMKKNPEGVAGSSLSGSSVAYATSKAGMNHVTRCLAKALAPEIRVNAVAPGLLVTRWGAKFGDAGIKAAVERSALKMPTSIQECAAAYVFLAKNGSTTGEIITVDAGITIQVLSYGTMQTRHRKAEDTISPSILMKNVSSSPSLPTPKSSPSSPTLLALPITNGLQPNSDRSSQPENKQTNMPNSLSTLAGTEISALAAGDDVSYKRELINQKVRAENRERKKRWREQNEEKNKDNDLRCRVNKRATKLFGRQDSEHKQKWIEEEFLKRQNKRKEKERRKSMGGATSMHDDHKESSPRNAQNGSTPSHNPNMPTHFTAEDLRMLNTAEQLVTSGQFSASQLAATDLAQSNGGFFPITTSIPPLSPPTIATRLLTGDISDALKQGHNAFLNLADGLLATPDEQLHQIQANDLDPSRGNSTPNGLYSPLNHASPNLNGDDELSRIAAEHRFGEDIDEDRKKDVSGRTGQYPMDAVLTLMKLNEGWKTAA